VAVCRDRQDSSSDALAKPVYRRYEGFPEKIF
jgi:hypothetical protein